MSILNFNKNQVKVAPVKVHYKPKTERRYERVNDVVDFCRILNKHGDRVALSYFDKKRKLHDVTYAELENTAKKIAAGITAMGISGKKIAVIGETSVAWITSYIGTLASGSVVIPMDKELEADVILDFLAWVEADAIVYSEKFNDAFEAAKGNHKSLKYFIPMVEKEGAAEDNFTVSFDKLLEIGEAEIENGYNYPPVKDKEKLAEMLFTSGTTGSSKSVMLSQKNIFAVVNSAAQTVDFTPEDTIVSVLPIHHTYELACMLAGFLYGMHICINDSLSHLLKNFKIFKPTGLVLVPLFIYTMYKRIWAEAKKTGKDKLLKVALGASKALTVVGIDKRREIMAEVHDTFGGNLKKIVCGGAALNPKMVEFFEALGITVCEGFGITECAPLVCVNPYFARKYGSVGPSVPCCQVRIAGEATNDAGFIEGEIQVKGDNVMIGYFDNDEANADVFTEDNWFRTGDVGYLDTHGYLFITGRLKSVIVLENGKNVFPEEIEEYLSNIELVAESVVVGRAEKLTDKVVLTAIIYPDYTKFDEKVSDETVRRALENEIASMNKKLPTYKQIKEIEITKTEFEKTTSKKIKRHLVK